ncbi:MAG TPA: response regulator transcription factor, partial [Oligoflexia bacterium]|nr:response regulator transcription factor [Oligoflexia bacterium]
LNPETCKVEGLDVCRKARNHTPDLAIIVISPAFDEIDKIVSLEIGADDYLALPFNPRELAARIKSLFRRASALNRLPEEDGRVDSLEFGELAIDQTHRRVTIGRKEVELTAKEFELLTFLAKKPGRPYTREQILHKLWGYDSSGYDPLITTYVARLRAKIETNPEQPRYILTVRGVGYKFAEKESLASCGAKDNK